MSESPSIHHGIKWVTVSMLAAQFVRLVSQIVLARLLTPEMFGLVAMAYVAITLIAVIREVGVGTAYIQRQDRTRDDADLAASTTFWLSSGVSAVIFLVAFAGSPLIAGFFEAQGLGLDDVLRVMFLVLLFDGVTGTPDALLRKRLEFGRHAFIEIVESVTAAAVAIALATLDFGVWSLVFGQLSAQFARVSMLFRATRWRPSLRFDREIARELIAYGKYLWAFSIVSAISRSLDQLLIGRLLGAANLGVYSLGVNLCKLPANRINSVVIRISFPVLSRLQADPDALRAAFLKTLRHVSIIAFPAGVGLFAVAESFVLTVYGAKWAAMVPVIQILPFYAVSLSVSATTGPVFQAIARPQVLLYTSLVHQAVLLALLFALARFGLAGICVAVLIPSFVSSIIAFSLVTRYLQLRPADVLRPLARSGVASGLMWLAVEALQREMAALVAAPMPVVLAASVLVGACVYLAATAALNREDLVELTASVRRVVAAKGEVV